MGRSFLLSVVTVTTIAIGPSAVRGGHPILGAIDLHSGTITYPYTPYYGNEITYRIVVHKNVAYVTAHGDNTLFSLDITDPTNPVLLDYLDISMKGEGLEIVEDTAYVASWGSGLRVFDVSDPGNIDLLWTYRQIDPKDPACWEVDVYRNRAYVSMAQSSCGGDYHCGIRILDISEPIPPDPLDTHISTLTTSDRNLRGVAVRGSYAFYTDGLHFEVANVSDEDDPRIIKSFHFPDAYMLHGVRLLGDYAYVYGAGGTPGLIIYDVSDPTDPVEEFRYTAGGGNDLHFMGDRAFLAHGGIGIQTLDITDPVHPILRDVTYVDAWTDAVSAWEGAVSGNGRYIYIGTQEMYYHPENHPDAGNNYYRGKFYTAEVFTEDPDDLGPGRWSDISLGDASWDTQYEGDVIPTAASPAWQVLEGSEIWASTSGGILRVNDTGTQNGDKIKWWRNWEATHSLGATVLVRARCAAHEVAGGAIGYMGNIFLENGKHQEQFAILSDRIRANQANQEYPLDGTEWHTYRITMKQAQFAVYVDEGETPVLSGPLSQTTGRSRVAFGSGASASKQDIYFDYVHCFSGGEYPPPMAQDDPAPTISVRVADTAGKGSLSGISPSTARVMWSTDGGVTWAHSGVAWDAQYEGDVLASVASPAWTVAEGDEGWASVAGGILTIQDTSTAWGSKVKWARSWGASPLVGTTIFARARCLSTGGDTQLLGNLYVEDGAHVERLKIMTDRIEAVEADLVYLLDATQWRVYRVTTRDDQFAVYVDEDPTPVLAGTLVTPTTQNRVMFGSGASLGMQTIDFDYVRYTATGDLPPGQGNGGNVPVWCTGQFGDDRGVMTAQNIPFHQGSSELNKVRFTLRDAVGNLGLSPIYNVRIEQPPSPDLDGDLDVDQVDFGYLQVCLSGPGTLPTAECEGADLDFDRDVDQEDMDILIGCMCGANVPFVCE